MNKQALRFLTRGFILLTIIFFLDRGIGSVIQYFLKNEKQGDSSITTYALTKASEEVIIFGSSRASHHYVPQIIKEKTQLTTFNVGRDGMNLSYYLLMLQGVLAHHTPKVVILDLDLHDFTLNNSKEEEMITNMLPYINDNPVVQRILKDKSPMELWKARLSMLYRFNSLPVSILQHYMQIGQKHNNGYEALTGNKIKFIADTLEENPNYQEDAGLIKKFEEFITTLKNKSVTVYVVISPTAKKTKFNAKATASKTLVKHGLKLYDYSEFSGDQRTELFYDRTHMNDFGARMFTKTLVQDLLAN